ncbi:MAG: hypothetical protein U0521_13830 [Anaerolineae bacterium]
MLVKQIERTYRLRLLYALHLALYGVLLIVSGLAAVQSPHEQTALLFVILWLPTIAAHTAAQSPSSYGSAASLTRLRASSRSITARCPSTSTTSRANASADKTTCCRVSLASCRTRWASRRIERAGAAARQVQRAGD